MTTASGIPVEAVYTEAPAIPRPTLPLKWKTAARRPANGVDVVISEGDLFTAVPGADAVTEIRCLLQAPANRILSVRIHSDFFEEIAKLRALRVLTEDRIIHAVSDAGALAGEQPENNIVRATWHTMAAILGGADWVETVPWNKTEAAFALSVQTQQVLRYESGLAVHAGIVAGSYYVEALTAELIRQIRDTPEGFRSRPPEPVVVGVSRFTPR